MHYQGMFELRNKTFQLSSLEHCKDESMLQMPHVPAIDSSSLLNGVAELPLPTSVGSLCVFGPLALPLVTAACSSSVPDKCDGNNRHRLLSKIEKINLDNPVSFHESYIATASFGKGKVVAIADTRAFDALNFEALDSSKLLTNIFTHFNNNGTWNILCYCSNIECLSPSIIKHLKGLVTITSSYTQFCTSIMQGECTSVMVIFSAMEKYSEKELQPIATFVEQGGSALVLGSVIECTNLFEYAGSVLLVCTILSVNYLVTDGHCIFAWQNTTK